MKNNIGINIRVNDKMAKQQIKSFTDQLKGIGRQVDSNSKSYNKFNKSNRKLRDTFSNLNKDVNRSSKEFNKLGGSLLSLGNIIKGVGLYRLAGGLVTAIKSAFDMIETTHLFNVAMGDLAEETNEVLIAMSELSGLDLGNLRNRVGTFNLLAKTMGITGENAQTLALNSNQLALDMGSLFNIPYQQVAEDLRSGLIGQSRTMYKYGVDVTEASIAQEALNQGITKSVRHMAQGEKMALRYTVMIKQMSDVHGDFAKTINTPMNQLRLLRERFATLSRTIGAVFLPMMAGAIRVINAVVIALTRLFRLLGKVFGIDSDMNDAVKDTSGAIGGIGDSAEESFDDITGGAGKAETAVKKLKRQLGGFDELNILGTPDTPDTGGAGGGGAGGIGGGSPLDIDLEGYDGLFDKIEDKSETLANNISEYLKKVADSAKPTTDALKELWELGLKPLGKFVWDNLGLFYKNFLVPVGKWFLGDKGIPKLVKAITNLMKDIDWDKLNESFGKFYKALARFTIGIGQGLIDFFEDLINFLKPFILKLLDWFGISLEDLADALNRIPEDKLQKLGYDIGAFITIIMGVSIIGKIIDKFKTLIGIIKGIPEVLGGLSADPTTLVMLFYPMVEKLMEWIDKNAPKWVGDLIRTLGDIVTGMSIGAVIGSWFGPGGMIGGAVIGGIVGLAFNAVQKWFEKLDEATGGRISTWFGKRNREIKDAMDDLPGWFSKKFTEIWGNVTVDFVKTKIWFDKNVKQPISDKFDEIKGIVKEKIESSWDSVTKAYENTKTWFEDNVKKPVTDKFDEIKKGIKDKIDESWKSVTDAFDSTKTWFEDNVKTPIGTVFSDIYKNIKDWLDEKVSVIFSFKTWSDMVGKAKDGMVDGFTKGLNAVIRQFNRFIGWINDKLNISWDGLSVAGKEIIPRGGFQLFKIPSIPQLADGGMINAGQLFIANEDGPELVGSYGSKSAVMNNDQIVNAVSEGVARAVGKTLGTGNSGTPIIVKVGEDTLVDKVVGGINRQNIVNGKSVINV